MFKLLTKGPICTEPPEETTKMEASKEGQPPKSEKSTSDLIYSVEDTPPWYECIVYGFQHYLAMVGGTISIPIIISSRLCMDETNPARGHLVSTIIFMSGVITFLQSTFGVRLPIIQGGNFAYVVPTIALLTTTFEQCSSLPLGNMTEPQKEDLWQIRMREVQGSIAVSALVQIFIGFTGVIGLLLNWITPLVIVPTVSLVGLSLFHVASSQGSGHWGIYIMTVSLAIIFSQHMRDINVPMPIYKKGRGLYFVATQPFKTIPLLLIIFISWISCAILTQCDLLPEGSAARTDMTLPMINKSPWVSFPYPGQWGIPTVSMAGVIGMMAAVFASVIESIGDYYACARVAGAPLPPTHAINRGIGMEGIGCMLAGLWGTSSGTTSYSGNIGILSITKVGSRRVIQYAAVIMMICGVFGKMGALFVTIPEPIIAAVFTVKFSMITAVGISSAQFIDLKSSRNLFILGFSIFTGLSIPKWAEANPTAIQTGIALLDHTLMVLLQTSMFIGGLLGLVLDNTVPGTDEERGLLKWKGQLKSSSTLEDTVSSEDTCYDLPFGMTSLNKWSWTRYLPFCPTFRGFTRSSAPPETPC